MATAAERLQKDEAAAEAVKAATQALQRTIMAARARGLHVQVRTNEGPGCFGSITVYRHFKHKALRIMLHHVPHTAGGANG